MSLSRPLEQVLLTAALRHMEALPPRTRSPALEAAAASVGGFSIDKFWNLTGQSPDDPGRAVDVGRALAQVLAASPIPPSLALSALARRS